MISASNKQASLVFPTPFPFRHEGARPRVLLGRIGNAPGATLVEVYSYLEWTTFQNELDIGKGKANPIFTTERRVRTAA